MPLLRYIPRIVKSSFLAFLVLSGVLMTGPATAGPLPPAASPAGAGPRGEVKVALAGPRRVVVRDLPAPAVTATERTRQVVAPRRLPPQLTPGPLAAAPAANAVDPAFSAESEANTPPGVSTANFEGLDNDDNGALTGFIVRPPDPQLAVGPDHVFEMVNVVGRIYTRTGGTVQTFTLADFFQLPTPRCLTLENPGPPCWSDTDPKIIYDALSGRWFASYVSAIDKNGSRNDEGRLHLAISQTSDPTGAWNVYFRSYSRNFPDYAGIGLTNDKFTISSNIFDIDALLNAYRGEETVVIEKADVLAGVPAGDLGLFAFPFNLNRFTVRPAHSLSPVDDQYLVTRSLSSSTALTLIRITGTPDAGNVTEAAASNLSIISQTAPPDSLTAGGAAIDSGDQRLLDAMWREDSLWTSASARCRPTGDSTDRSCAHLIEVNATPPAAPTIAQDIMFGAAGEYFSWPAVRTDASGDVYVSLTHTNSSIFAEARAAGRLASEPLNTMSGSILMRAGDVVNTGGRWGDYLGAAVDPNFPECVWMVGQYAKDIGASSLWDWGTYIAATSYSGGCDGDNDGMPDAYEGAHPCLLPNTNDAGADPDADGFTNFIEFFVGTDPCNQCAATATANDEDPDPGPADFNDSQNVDGFDAFLLAERFGSTTSSTPPDKLPYQARYDLNADAAINDPDVVLLRQVFHTNCS